MFDSRNPELHTHVSEPSRSQCALGSKHSLSLEHASPFNAEIFIFLIMNTDLILITSDHGVEYDSSRDIHVSAGGV